MSLRTMCVLAIAGGACCASALGAPVLITFEGLQDHEEVNGYYAGSSGGFGTGPGPSWGVFFSSGAQSIVDFDAGGTGNIANEPSGDTVLSFTVSSNALMNVPDGFTLEVSAWYSSISATGTISVFDGAGGAGNLLASINLIALGSNAVGDPNGAFNRWQHVVLAFAGTAHSVVFGGLTNQIAFDNIEFANVVPGPSTGAAGLLAGLVALRRRRR